MTPEQQENERMLWEAERKNSRALLVAFLCCAAFVIAVVGWCLL